MVLYRILFFINIGLHFLSCFATNIAPNVCDFNVKLKQVLRNEGFHRNITYGIVFDNEDDRERWLYKNCIVGLDQTLPAGVYANPDELGDLRRTRKLNALPKNRVNIELPTEQSSPSSVYVVGKVTKNRAYLWLPVHARYHSAVTGGGLARNEIGSPKLYLRCPDDRLGVCNKDGSSSVTLPFLCNGNSKEMCHWNEIPYTLMTGPPVWHVPRGDLAHYYAVAGGTSAALALATLYLATRAHRYARARGNRSV